MINRPPLYKFYIGDMVRLRYGMSPFLYRLGCIRVPERLRYPHEMPEEIGDVIYLTMMHDPMKVIGVTYVEGKVNLVVLPVSLTGGWTLAADCVVLIDKKEHYQRINKTYGSASRKRHSSSKTS